MMLASQNAGTGRFTHQFLGLLLLLISGLFGSRAEAQLTGTRNIPGDYADLAAAITDLNTVGVGAGGVTLNLGAGNPQTSPVGGYSVTTLTGSGANPITIQGNGNTITAPTPQTSGALNDAIFKIIGADFVTISGFTMLENAANTTTAAGTNNMTEFGVVLYYASTTDGARNITIQNNTITLNRTYQNTFGIYSNSRHSATTLTVADITAPSGANDDLRIYGNIISNVNMGIAVIGSTTGANMAVGLDIGGNTAPTGNTISNYGTTGTFSAFPSVSGSVNGILLNNQQNFNVSRNSVTSSVGGVTGAFSLRGIYVQTTGTLPVSGAFTRVINNNTISVRSAAVASAMLGIANEGGNATTSLTINNNDFNTTTHTVASSGAVTLLSNTGTTFNTTINGNTFTNLSLNTTGNATLITNSVTHPAGAVTVVNNNSIQGTFAKTGAGGTVRFYDAFGSTTAGSETNTGNNFSNVTLTGATTFGGWRSADGGAPFPNKTVTNNTFSNLTVGTNAAIVLDVSFSPPGSNVVSGNVISNVVGGGPITGISSTAGSQDFLSNTVSGLSSTGASAVTGISITGAVTQNASKNKVYDLQANNAAGTVNGILITAGTTINVFNNLIGDLRTPATSAVDAIRGISMTSTTASSAINLSFNSIFLNATSSGPNFGTSGVFHTTNATASTATLNLRSNNIVNLSTPAGTGATVAYRRSSIALNNFGAVSNNNNFYAGTPGAANLIFFDGTNSDQTLASYKARVATIDSASVSENPAFLSTTGSNAQFLHINTVTPTQLESSGVSVAGIADDFDGNVRNATTPDIGADEFAGVLLDVSPPAISYSGLSNTTLTTNRTLSVSITDASGVAGGPTSPRVYFRKNAGTYVSTQCTGSSPSYTCTIDNGLLGGVVVGDVVNYYVIAQDTAGNVGSNPAAGLVAADVNTVTTPPTSPNTYSIISGFVATVNVGTGETFTSLTNAGGLFQALNGGVLTSNVVVNITSDLSGELGTVALNALVEEPAGSNFTLKISPTGSARVITGTFNGALIRLNGASRVTIDGSIGGTGTDRSLTITNTSVTTPSVVLFGSTGSTPITNDTLRNSIIINGANTSSAVVISDAATVGTAGFFSNITIQNNDIQRAFVGVFATGGTTPQNGSNLTYTQNTVNTSGANAVRTVGLYMQGVNGATVSLNTVGNLSAVEGENDTGIWLATGSANVSVSGNTVSNLGMTLTTAFAPFGIRESSGLAASGNSIAGNTVTNLTTTGNTGLRGIAVGSGGVTVQSNKVQGVINNNTGTFGAFGIDVIGGNDAVIRNNFVSDINHNMTGGGAFGPDFGVVGIRLGAGTGHRIYFNSVNLFGLHPGTATTSLLSAAFSISTTAQTGIDVRNNIFANNITGGTTSIAHVSVFLPSGGTSAMNLTWNNNAYYFGTDVARQGVGQAGTTAGTGFFTTLPALAAYSVTLSPAATNDNASQAASTAVPFVSGTDLHIGVGSAPVNAGTPIAGVTVDIDGDPRIAPAPEIGADELVDPNTAPGITPTAGGITRQQDSPASNSQIAVVSDTETAAGSLVVTTQGALPTGISVSNIVNSTGNITADVAASCSAATGANLVGLRVTDAGAPALFTDANLTVNVTANTAPVLGTYPASNATTGIDTTVTPNVAPSDNGSIASITASAPGFTGSFSVNTSSGVVTVTNPGPANVYTVTVTATDGCGQQSTTTFQLTVSNSNAAPVITPGATLTRQRGSAATSGALAAVTDDTPAQNVVVTAQTVPAGLTVTGITNTAGAITGNVAASCTATLGNNTVVLRATDPGALFSDGNLTVDVTANTAVVQGVYPATSVAAGASTTVTPDAAPTDNGSITSITAAAPGFTGSFSVNTSTGVVTITNAGPGGVFTVTVTATDNCSTTSTRTFTLTVNALPTIVAASVTLKAGDLAAVRTIANVSDNEDPENTLAITINGGATASSNGVTVGSIAVDAGGIVTANVLASCSATDASFTLRVTDSGSLFRETTLNTVVTANTAPLLSYGTTTLPAGTGIVIGPSTGPTDSGMITSIAVQSAGTFFGGVTVAPSGNVTLTNAAPEGSHTLTIRATDNCGATTDAALLVNVLGDALFANGFEDIALIAAKMRLPLGEEGVLQSLVLPLFELQDLAGARDLVNVVEFEIGSTRTLLQVQGATGYREMRLLHTDSQGTLGTGAWMEMPSQAVLLLQWRALTIEGVLQVQTALKVVED